MVTPVVVPFIITLAPGTGPELSDIVPVILLPWAKEFDNVKTVNNKANATLRYLPFLLNSKILFMLN